jgi:hypothetical protein
MSMNLAFGNEIYYISVREVGSINIPPGQDLVLADGTVLSLTDDNESLQLYPLPVINQVPQSNNSVRDYRELYRYWFHTENVPNLPDNELRKAILEKIADINYFNGRAYDIDSRPY